MDKQSEEIIKNANESSSKYDNIFLTKLVLNALKDSNFQKLSPFQHTSLPLGISGFDLLIKEHPGAGRIVLYAILALELIKIDINHAQVLILTSEEEIQNIKGVITTLGHYLDGLIVYTSDDQTENNIINCHVAIGVTNTLKNLIDSGMLITDDIALVILDNSDKLVEFHYPIFEQFFQLLPSKRQTLSFASNYSKEAKEFLKRHMNHPIEISHEIESSALFNFNQFVCIINQPQDYTVSITEAKTTLLCNILSKISFTRCIIYTNDESKGIYLSKTLQDKSWNSFYAPFFVNDSELKKKIKKSKCLISTNCLDMKKFNCNVDVIINYDIPLDSADYIERIGKVRNNAKGIYINLVLPGEELEKFEGILGEIGGPEMSVPKLDIDDSYFEDIWNVETSSLDHICGITKDYESDKLKQAISDIVKYRLEQCEEEGVASKLKNLSVDHKNHENSKLRNILEELASGKTCNPKPSNEGNSITSTKVQDQQQNENDKKLKTLLEIFTAEIDTKEKKLNNNNNEQQIKNKSVNTLLQNLALGNMTQQKEAPNNNPDDILTRNLALLNVAKLITNCDILQENEISKEITQPLNAYLNSFKKTVSTSLISLDCDSQSENSVSNEKNCSTKEDNFHLKDIFKIGYDFLIKPISSLKTTEDTKNIDDKLDDSTIPAKADKRKTRSRKNKNKNSKRSKFCEDHDETVNRTDNEINESYDTKQEMTACAEENLTIQENLEVDEGIYTLTDTRSSTDQVAESYFDYYSNILWNDGLTFDDVSSFDEWFAQWQAQVQSVRNYIQQKIYLDEMNKFQ